jgi:hypothetical protein
LDGTGTWSVLLQGDLTATASSTLVVTTPASVGTVPVNGAATALDVTYPGQQPELTFSGTDGETVNAVTTNVTTSDYGGCATLSLVDPQGSVAYTNGSCSTGNAPFSLSIGTVSLDGTGTWSVLLQGDLTATASSTVVVTTPASVGTVPVNGGATTLDVSYPGEQPELTFAGTSGESINAVTTNVTASDYEGCATLSLVDPQGNVAYSNGNCSTGNVPFSLAIGTVALDGTGTWSVLLQGDLTATATSTVVVATPASVGTVSVNGGATTLDVSYPGEQPELTFAGTSGESINAATTSVTASDYDGCATLSLVDPQGTVAYSNSNCSTGTAPFSLSIGTVMLSGTGTWSVMLQADLTATATSTVSVTNGP